MTKYYTKVSIIKPRSSRYCNSERYVVCRGFRSVGVDDIVRLKDILKNWPEDEYCRDLGVNIKSIYRKIKPYNAFLVRNQVWYIDKSLKLCKINNPQYCRELQVSQNKKGVMYCMVYGFMDMKECKHMNKNVRVRFDGYNLSKCNDCLEEFLEII